MFWGPIFARELLTTPRRIRHFIVRTTYIGLLFVLMWTMWQALIGFQQIQRIGDFAHFNYILFQFFAYAQLRLVLFVASVYGATSISNEKDQRTFILLLATRLRDSEIVLDKYLCAMLQVGTLLVAALPVFMLTALLGGVSYWQIATIYAVTIGAALIAGATGVLMGAWREKTFQAIALALLSEVLALLVVESIAAVFGEGSVGGVGVDALCACLSPMRAIAAAVGVGERVTLPFAIEPGIAYLFVSSTGAALILFYTTLRLRAWNPRGEPVLEREPEDEAAADSTEPRPDRFRRIWDNPVLWREVMTRAYGTKPALIKASYLTIIAIILWRMTASTQAGDPRSHLIAAAFIVPASILSLIIINLQAVTAVTTERDNQAIDLLLATDITPKELIFGKLFGILYNTKEMVAAPLVLVTVALALGFIETIGFLYVNVSYLVFVLFTAFLGIHAGLRFRNSRLGIAHSLLTSFLLYVGIILCLIIIVISGRFEAQWASFVLFIVLGSIGLWISLSANAPSNAIGVAASLMPFATFYCIIAFLMGERTRPFMVGAGVYAFAILALAVPLVSEFDVATGRTSHEEGSAGG